MLNPALSFFLPDSIEGLELFPYPQAKLFCDSCFKVRDGRVAPNHHRWQAGDVILSKSNSSSPVVPFVQRVVLGKKTEFSNWTHIAIYDGFGMIWDVNPLDVVKKTPIGEYMPKVAAAHVRRLRNNSFDPNNVVSNLLTYEGEKYTNMMELPGLISALGARIRRENGVKGSRSEPDQSDIKSLICSNFVVRILRVSGARNILSDVNPPILPADFAASYDFDCERPQWFKVGSCEKRQFWSSVLSKI